MKVYNPLENIEFAASTLKSLDLPTNVPTAGYMLELSGSLDIDGALTLRDEAVAQLIRSVILRADGREIQRWTGPALRFWNYYINGRLLPHDTPGTGVADPEPFRQVFFLPMEAERSGNPRISVLPTTRYRSLQLDVNFGSTTDIFSAGTASINTGCVVGVHPVEVPGSESPQSREPVVQHISETISAANSAKRIRLPREFLVRGVIIRVSDSATGYALSDTLLNNVILKVNGSDTRFDASYQKLQNLMHLESRFSESYETPGIDGSDVEGYGVIDFLKYGLGDLVDPRIFTQFDIEVDVDASTKLDVFVVGMQGA